MKASTFSLLTVLLLALAPGSRAEDGWISMFNGKDLTGWKSNAATEEKADEKTNVFTVEDGLFKISGGRAHIFYVGPDGKANFKNFELKAKVMTQPGANSGIYFHTAFEEKGWPSKGFECQVNATHTDRKKTGGLYAVADVMDNAPNKDNVWCDYYIKVEGKHVIIKIDDKVTADWTQPENWEPPKGMPGRVIGEGTIALQGHDPKSTTFYKDIFIRRLP
jgi:Domain of Unknown Function (DUF1080)